MLSGEIVMYYRATEYDSLTNGMTDDEKKNAESWKYKERETLLKEKENKMKISQLIYQFQKNFSGRVDKLQQNISDFETEINDFVEEEQRKLVNWQITMLIDRSIQNKTDLQKYYKQYINKKHQLAQLYMQLPVSYVTSDGNVMGFNKYGQFVATFDSYENQTAILYEENKIVAVKDTDNRETTFEYNNSGLLYKIVGADEKIISFEYDSNGLLTKIIAPNNETARFTYCDDGEHHLHDGSACANYELKTVTDNNGGGVEFLYDDHCKIVKVNEFTEIYSVSDEMITKETTPVTQTVATIEYKSQTSTSVTNKNGVTTTYIFDQLGKPVTVFEGVYDDPEDTTKSVSFEYADSKQSYAVEEDLTTENILKNIDPAGNTLNNATGIRQLKYVIPKEKFGDKTDFVFSAWAHADSAYVTNNREMDYALNDVEIRNKSFLDANQQNRKFELRAVVNYDSGNPDVYAASFDWLNTDWQFLTLPIEIKAEDKIGDKLPTVFPFVVGNEKRKLVNVELYVDYSYNTGEILTDCLSLREGKWTYSTFDGNGRKLTDEDSQTKCVTNYYYDDNDRVTKQVLTDRQYRKFTSTFEYNKQNSLVRSTNFAGVVEETVFDEKGRELKKITYNVDDPTSKFYQESKRDDKGVITADVDESGKYDSVKYTYDHNNEAIVHTDGKGNKTAFGYKDGNLVSISGSADGQESTNTMKYTADLLTKVSNGDTSYSYEYDGWGRTKKVEIADVTYAETEYVSDFETKTVLAGTIESASVADKYGNVRQQTTVFDNGATETVTNNYDDLLNLQSVNIDTENGNGYNITYTRDKDKIVSEVRSGDYALEKSYGYNADGDIEHTTYKVAEQELTYTYETDNTPDKRNSKVQLPFDVEQKFAYDGLGRTKEISLGDNLVKDIYYAKYGDHATNRVNSVWYGINGIRKDNTKYTYDKAGNIETITENGKLVARYQYDGLNRITREDNVRFGTFTYQYDTAGNLLSKTEYAYTLSDTLGQEESVKEYSYNQDGWKDRLLSFNGESCQYDVIGNPIVYRNRTLSWQGRRLLRYGNNEYYAEYTYDVNGMRTSKHAVTPAGTVNSKFIYDNNNLVAEQRNGTWIYYLYGVDGVAGFSYNNETYLYRKNVQGDVTHIYKREEDKSLILVAEYVYDAWGNNSAVLNLDGIATLNSFRYRSYYFDEETGLYYLQTRYYDPELGRFISADSIEYLDPETVGGLNLYAYCGNNPVMAVDSEGTAWWHWLIGALVVVALVAATIISAGSAAAGIMAIGCAINGIAFGSATTATLAFVTVGAGITFAGMAGYAAITATDTWIQTGSFNAAVNSFMNLGSEALSMTVTGGIIGGIGGYISYKQQIGNPSQNGFMTPNDRKQQREYIWKDLGYSEGHRPKGTDWEISHIYGTFGNNRNYYEISHHPDHIAFHKLYGYKTNGGPFNRISPNYINWWQLLKHILGGW